MELSFSASSVTGAADHRSRGAVSRVAMRWSDWRWLLGKHVGPHVPIDNARGRAQTRLNHVRLLLTPYRLCIVRSIEVEVFAMAVVIIGLPRPRFASENLHQTRLPPKSQHSSFLEQTSSTTSNIHRQSIKVNHFIRIIHPNGLCRVLVDVHFVRSRRHRWIPAKFSWHRSRVQSISQPSLRSATAAASLHPSIHPTQTPFSLDHLLSSPSPSSFDSATCPVLSLD